MSRAVSLLVSALAICLLSAVAVQAAPGPWVSYRLDPESPWTVEVDTVKGLIMCRHAEHENDGFEVDYDGSAPDGRFPGVRPIVNGVSMSGLFFYNQAPFLSPPFYGDASACSVETDGDTLHVGLEGDDFRDLNLAAGDEPLRMQVAVTYREDGIHIDLYGLYYILPSSADTQFTMISDGEAIEKHITPDSEVGYTYYPEVTRVDVSDSVFGDFYFKTYCQWFQVQVHDVWELFEFDFDHAFKDYGQREVLTRLVLPYPDATAE